MPKPNMPPSGGGFNLPRPNMPAKPDNDLMILNANVPPNLPGPNFVGPPGMPQYTPQNNFMMQNQPPPPQSQIYYPPPNMPINNNYQQQMSRQKFW